MILVILFLTAVFAGFIQGLTGFGCGLLFMSVAPAFLPMISSASISSFISIFLTLGMAIKYRKHVQWKYIPVPTLFFVVSGMISIYFASRLNTVILKGIFGVFLILLSVYFLFWSDKVRLQANFLTMFICGTVSGICDGLFGVGGPLMVLFFLALCDSKEEYLGTIQTFFLISCTFNFIFRVSQGLFDISLLKTALFCAAGVLGGMQSSHFVMEKLDGNWMKKLTYGLIGVSGIVSLAAVL